MADDFNMSMRKFLKQVGVTSQQEIEKAVRDAAAAGRMPAGGVRVKMVLSAPEIGLERVVEGTIRAGDAA